MGWMKKVLFAFGALAAILSPAAAFCDETFEQALSLASEKRYAEAREVLDPLLEREPGHPRARLLHGILRARSGRVSEAIDVFEALRRDHPAMSEPYNNLAVLYAVDGRLDDARRTLLAALERQQDAVVYANLGDVYTKLARRAYQQAHEIDPAGNVLPDEATDAPFPLAKTPVVASQAEPAQGAMAAQKTDTVPQASLETPPAPAMKPAVAEAESQQPKADPSDVAMKPAAADAESQQQPVAGSPDVAAKPQGTAMESADPVAGAAGAVAAAQSVAVEPGESGTEPRESGTTPVATPSLASATESTPDGFCVHAGGFDGRRAVAEAALWLRSYGAEIVEVRHEKQKIASSYRVYLPPFPSREDAAAKLREIQQRGVRDVALIKDGALANAISFGVYGKSDNMHRRVAALDRLGYAVRSQAEDVEAIEEYVIKTRASGAPVDLDAAWKSQFPDYSLKLADCG